MKAIFYLLFLLHTALVSANLDTVIRQLPEWKEHHLPYDIEKIETGITNHNFKVIFPFRSYFVRLCRDNPEQLGLNCDHEIFCSQTAASLGIAPPIVLYLPDEQAIVFPFIQSKPFEKKGSSYSKLFDSLKKYHESGVVLPTTFCPYQVIQDYFQHAVALRADHHIPLASFMLSIADEIWEVLPPSTKLVPCHLDLYGPNFLDDGNQIWVVDWEYSAMAEPLYDLATLVSSERLSFDETRTLLELYQDRPTHKEVARLYLLSILADIRWWLWCYIQAETSQIPAPYLKYADDILLHSIQKITDTHFQISMLITRIGIDEAVE